MKTTMNASTRAATSERVSTIGSISTGQSPLRVKSVGSAVSAVSPPFSQEPTSSVRSAKPEKCQQVTFETKEAAEIPVVGPSASSEGVYHQFGFSVHGFALAI